MVTILVNSHLSPDGRTMQGDLERSLFTIVLGNLYMFKNCGLYLRENACTEAPVFVLCKSRWVMDVGRRWGARRCIGV